MPRPLKSMILACATTVAIATTACAQDRYGPGPPSDFSVRDAARPADLATPLRARFLSWPGKSVPRGAIASAASVPTAQAALQGRFSNIPTSTGRSLTAYRAAPVSGDGVWRPVPMRNPDAVRPTTLAGTPQQTDTTPPTPAQVTQPYGRQPAAAAYRWGMASADAPKPGADHVRFYSLHRQYGLQPDPPPIPPQFFAATADMSEPAGPIAAQRLTSTSGGASTTRTLRGTDASDGTAQP